MTLETKRFMLLFEVQLHICHCFSALLRKKFSSVTLKCKPSLMCKHTVDLCFSCFYQTAVNSSLRALWLRPPANVLRGVHWPWLTVGFSNSYKRADFLLKAQLTSLKCFCTFKPALKKTQKTFAQFQFDAYSWYHEPAEYPFTGKCLKSLRTYRLFNCFHCK